MSFQKIIKSFTLTAVALYLTTLIIPGFTIQQGMKNILIATLALTILNTFIRPIIKVLLLPVNLLTLGTFRWLINIILLYMLTLIIPEVTIQGFILSDIPSLGTILPSITVGRFVATIIVSLGLSFTQSLLFWLIK